MTKIHEKKKVLIVASVISFVEWFNKENVDYLHKELDCEVEIACNFDYMDDTDVERTISYINKLKMSGIKLHNIKFARNPLNKANKNAFKELKLIIDNGNYDLIHCHTPTASMMTRLAAFQARKNGSKVMYTCHGFHFHNASPKKNWLIYYPIEKELSRFCDYLITINKEDYQRAKKFYCKNVRYIPGVGVDLTKIKKSKVNKNQLRNELGIPKSAFVILSVGELIDRKNHKVIIKALKECKNENIYYVIAGKGELQEYLTNLSIKLGVKDRVKLLGFRTDISRLYYMADISAFPSKIEGLGLAGIEAMASGLPLISSNVHGILDYVINGETGYAIDPNNVNGFVDAINKLESNCKLRKYMSNNCVNVVEPFKLDNALNTMWDIYKTVLVGDNDD